MMGSRILDGEELEALQKRFAQLFPQLTWAEYDGSIEVKGKDTVDGVECYEVEFTPTVGSGTTRFFDAASGHTVKEVVTQDTPMGAVSVETYPSDYRDVNGIMLPFKNITSAPQGEMEMSFEEYKINEEIDAAVFELPESIKKLVEEAAGDDAEDGGTDG